MPGGAPEQLPRPGHHLRPTPPPEQRLAARRGCLAFTPVFRASEGAKGPTVLQDPTRPAPSEPLESCHLGKTGLGAGQNLGPSTVPACGDRGDSEWPLSFLPPAIAPWAWPWREHGTATTQWLEPSPPGSVPDAGARAAEPLSWEAGPATWRPPESVHQKSQCLFMGWPCLPQADRWREE